MPLPERLKQLDRDLFSKEPTKDYDYVWAVGHGMRIRVCVMRDVDNKCWATAQLGSKRAFRVGGGCSPSGAYLMLAVKLSGAIAEMTTADRERLRRELESEAVYRHEREAVLAAHHQAKSHTQVSA